MFFAASLHFVFEKNEAKMSSPQKKNREKKNQKIDVLERYLKPTRCSLIAGHMKKLQALLSETKNRPKIGRKTVML